MECRADVASLNALQDERRALIREHGRLIALHGPFGHHDDHRKRFVEAEKVRARMELSKQSEKKPTEAQIDSEAYGSAAYQLFLDQSIEDRIRYLEVQTRLDEINEQIRSRELELLVYNSEVKLAR